MGGGGGDAPDVVGAARQEGYNARLAAQAETLANRPNQYGPKSSTEWERIAINPNTGEVYDESTPDIGWDHDNHRPLGGYIAPGDRMYEWRQTTTLNPEWQQALDHQLGSALHAQHYRNLQTQDWMNNPANYQTAGPEGTIDRTALANFGYTNPTTGSEDWREFGPASGTIGQDDWQKFGTTDPNLGAQDWRQFGTSTPTITGAGDYQDLGRTEQTIGAGDWRQFGDTERTINSGDWDARWGSSQDHGFGDHDMGGGDWSYIDYAPEAIRSKAEQQTLAFMNSQLDPQWDTRRENLETQLANQGLQWGDAAWDNAISSFEKQRNTAYAGARNQALADSRAEAAMLWDQEMGRSEQKNRYHMADIDNEFRARQANIANALSGREQDMRGYLDYQQAAFGQDLAARQQQLDANLGYGREAFGQDLQSRQQQLDAKLNYGREAWGQDFQNRQQQLDANRDYAREAFDQDYRSRQQKLESDLAYGREAWNQDFQTRQQNLDANRLYDQQAFDQDLQARQQAISNYLNYGNAEFGQNLSREELALQQKMAQDQTQQDRYGLVNPGENYANAQGIMS